MKSNAIGIAKVIQRDLAAEPDIYDSGVATKLMELPEAYQACIRFISSDEFRELVQWAELAVRNSSPVLVEFPIWMG